MPGCPDCAGPPPRGPGPAWRIFVGDRCDTPCGCRTFFVCGRRASTGARRTARGADCAACSRFEGFASRACEAAARSVRPAFFSEREPRVSADCAFPKALFSEPRVRVAASPCLRPKFELPLASWLRPRFAFSAPFRFSPRAGFSAPAWRSAAAAPFCPPLRSSALIASAFGFP